MPRFLKSKIFNILPPNALDSFFEGNQLVSCFREGKDHQPATIDSLIDRWNRWFLYRKVKRQADQDSILRLFDQDTRKYGITNILDIC